MSVSIWASLGAGIIWYLLCRAAMTRSSWLSWRLREQTEPSEPHVLFSGLELMAFVLVIFGFDGVLRGLLLPPAAVQFSATYLERSFVVLDVIRSIQIIFLLGLTYRFWGPEPWRMGLHSKGIARAVTVGIAEVVAILPAITALNVLIRSGIPQTTPNPIQVAIEQPEIGVLGWAGIVFAAVVAAPIFEELFFRAVLQQWLVDRFAPVLGQWPGGMAGIVATSALFALAHAGAWPDPIPLFVLSLAFGFVYWKTRSIWASISMHAGFNLINFVIGMIAS